MYNFQKKKYKKKIYKRRSERKKVFFFAPPTRARDARDAYTCTYVCVCMCMYITCMMTGVAIDDRSNRHNRHA